MRNFVVSVNTGDFDLKYFKTKTITQCEEGKVCYGISVEKYIDGKLEEGADSGCISEEDGQVSEIIEKLAEGGVTPVAFCEVIDEMELRVH